MFNILLFHGVTKKRNNSLRNYNFKHIYYDQFYKILKEKKKEYEFYSINDLISFNLNKRKKPKNFFYIVTFDDGFKNNILACEILEFLKIPSIFYLTSGLINTKKIFWVDEIEDRIASSNKKKFHIIINENKRFLFPICSKQNKVKAIEKIKKICKNCSYEEKQIILKQIKKELKRSKVIKISDNYSLLNWRDVRKINDNKLFDIGGHSLKHDILTSKNLKETEVEIEQSINILEIKLLKKIIHYSYPEGQKNHYNKSIISILKKNGIKCSPSAIHGLNSFKTDLFNLKRIMVGFYQKNLNI